MTFDVLIPKAYHFEYIPFAKFEHFGIIRFEL